MLRFSFVIFVNHMQLCCLLSHICCWSPVDDAHSRNLHTPHEYYELSVA